MQQETKEEKEDFIHLYKLNGMKTQCILSIETA